MTNGSSQGLFVIVAVVIFGIFVAISYSLFRDQLSPSLASIFIESTEQVTNTLRYSPNYSINGDFNSYKKVDLLWDKTLNGEYTTDNGVDEFSGWTGGYNSGVPLPGIGYHTHLDFEKFGQPVMSFNNKNHLFMDKGVEENRWLGIKHKWKEDSQFMSELNEGSIVEVSFDLWSDNDKGVIRGGLFQPNLSTGKHEKIPGTSYKQVSVSEKETWERVKLTFSLTKDLEKDKSIAIYLYGHIADEHATKYIDNIEVRIVR